MTSSGVAVTFGIYFGALVAIVIGVAAFDPKDTFWALLLCFFVIIFTHPSYNTTPIIPERPLTDAEVKLQIVQQLRAHLESEQHSELYCGNDCPVADLLTKLLNDGNLD